MPQQQHGLGRGLGALIPQSQNVLVIPPEIGLADIDPHSITPNPEQPRQDFDDAEIHRLADSIRLYGLLHPIVIEHAGSGYRLVAGERRLRAVTLLGLPTIPAIIRPPAERQESLELALTENAIRTDLSAIEEAAAYQRLAETFGLSHEAIATRLGKNRSTVTNTIRLLNLPVPIQTAIRTGKLSAGHGRTLLGLDSEPRQLELAERIIAEGWTVRETELAVAGDSPTVTESLTSLVSPITRKVPTLAISHASGDAAYCRALEVCTGMSVHLKRTRRGGEIIFRFSDNDDLSTLYTKLGGEPL